MNNRMYRHAATQANLELLAARGVTMIGPCEGELASHGEHGIGRLAEPEALLEACEALLTAPTLAGLRVLVTAGGTREPIDTVRFIGNRSSGRMGFALAAEAARRARRDRDRGERQVCACAGSARAAREHRRGARERMRAAVRSV